MPGWIRALVAGGSIALLHACTTSSSTSLNPNAPGTARCGVTATAQPPSVGAPGGSGSVLVSTNRECAWEASSGSDWLSLGPTRAGQGDGRVTWVAAANAIASERRGAIDVNGTRVEIAQAAAACAFALDRLRTSVDAPGGRHDVVVTAPAGCAWSARTDAAWLSIVSGASGTGGGTVAIQVAANPSAQPRSGTLTIAGLTYTVDQAGMPPGGGAPAPPGDPSCTFAVDPRSGSFGAEGGFLEVTVTASAQTCTWTAQSATPWIALEGGVVETGTGRRRFIVAANMTDQPRTGTVGVAGTGITITQAAGSTPPPSCSFTITPTTSSVPAEGGSGEITVTASAGTCAWTAQSAVPWVTFQGAGSGTGSGVVRYTVAANAEQTPRTGALTVAGHAFALTQAAASAPAPPVPPPPAPPPPAPPPPAPPPPAPACAFSVAPSNVSVPANGGAGEITVTASASTCTWTARADDAWISLEAGGGTGSGRLAFTVAANSGAARTGSVTVAGRQVTIAQPAGPSEEVTVSGEIAGLTGSCPNVTFTLSGTTIVTSAATQYRANEACGNFRNGRQARVRGRVQPNGSVLAVHVENISGGGSLVPE